MRARKEASSSPTPNVPIMHWQLEQQGQQNHPEDGDADAGGDEDLVDPADAVHETVQKRSHNVPLPTVPAYVAIAALICSRRVPTLT